MNNLIPWIILVLPILIGYFALFVEMCDFNKRINEVTDYRITLIDFINELVSNKCFDNEEYIKLTKRINKIQFELGKGQWKYN